MKSKSSLLKVVLTFALATLFGLTSLIAATGMAYAAPVQQKVKSHAVRNGMVAGVAAYAVAKKTGKNRKLHGQKLNFAQRHPIISGMAAYGVAHHYSKKHAHKLANSHG